MDLFLDIEPNLAALSALFGDKFEVVIVEQWDPQDFALDRHVVQRCSNDSEFPVGLGFAHACEDPERWLLEGARSLSLQLNCRCLYTGAPGTQGNPFHCVLFDNGVAWLADDRDSRLSGDGEGPVRLLRRLPDLDAALD